MGNFYIAAIREEDEQIERYVQDRYGGLLIFDKQSLAARKCRLLNKQLHNIRTKCPNWKNSIVRYEVVET